ncbi:MAG TPA: tRNA uridine-5-carboxymethylaminomethyl(34) synthesis GTPase MnmE [Bdellovibrionales bacterium]|nr:tRNA uridine-5-carboxymethylaminomethyl(34) synthesis GTPase MnmE [Bdellovibrionales bacterium]
MFDAGRDQDTICALSTAAGNGGISVIRVSGGRSAEIARKICPFLPEQLKSHTVHFGTLVEGGSREPVDEVLVAYFEDGRSYTGEETLEISCHGSPAIAQTVLDELVKAGCRIAERGGFTFRAFMSGRIDLVQAEAVLSLVESQSKPAVRMALRQLKGQLSEKFEAIESNLVWLLARLEVSLDFSTEDIDVAPKDELLEKIDRVLRDSDQLLKTYNQGRILKEGLFVTLAGRPNVGKSSLLNAIMREDRAIVTDIAGTTRDVVEGKIRIDGMPVTLVDTAGLRETQDPIEKIGVEKTRKALGQGDVVLFVLDSSAGLTSEDEALLETLPKENLFFVFNKVDLISSDARPRLYSVAKSFGSPAIFVSSKSGEGLAELEKALANVIRETLVEDSDVVIQARHYQLLEKMRQRVEKARVLVVEGASEEFTALELRVALQLAHEVLGTEVDERVLDKIFGDFCIGK